MFDIGFFELVVIGVIGLLVLGPQRLPGAIRSTSRTIRNIKNMANGFKQEIEQQVRIQELHENLKKAEAQQLKNLAPELQESVDELKAAAASVNSPYRKEEAAGQKDATVQQDDSQQDSVQQDSAQQDSAQKSESLQTKNHTQNFSPESAIPASENSSTSQ